MKTVTVRASETYDVLIEGGLLEKAGGYIKNALKSDKTVIVSDDTVYPIYGKMLKYSLESAGFDVSVFVFAHGEQSKNLLTYGKLLEFMHGEKLTRSDAVIALGGGVTGDLAGFAAATYQRGIAYVQAPTTLLAAVDSSVGGKTGVDLKNGKNQVGCFHQPSLVLCDTDTLKTLPDEQYRCGCAEIIKYAFIRGGLYDRLYEKDISERYDEIIAECVDIKRSVVEEDEFDTGKRMLLNLGHTFGHAAESISGFTVPHGQAVAMGMAAVAKAAVRLGYCGKDTYDALIALLKKYKLPTEIPYDKRDMLDAVITDKKSKGNIINLVVPVSIGESRILPVPKDELGGWL